MTKTEQLEKQYKDAMQVDIGCPQCDQSLFVSTDKNCLICICGEKYKITKDGFFYHVD